MAVTRRREDRTSDGGANFIYLRDPWSGDVWSPTYHPVCREPDEYEATFEVDKVTFRRRDGDFETLLQVAVSPEDDVEVRRLSITNRGDRPREIEVTSYAEIVLARPEDDVAHPAFGKLFIETEYDAQSAGLLFSRRPRAADEAPAWAFHVLGVDGRLGGAVEWETDRARFLGRGRSPANPAALDGRALSSTTGAVLDPVAAVRERLRLMPGAFVRVTFATGVAPDRPTALALVRKYRDASAAARAFSMAFTHVHTALQHLGLTDEQAILFDRVASRVFGADASCISPADLARNTLGQSSLWRYGISGDLPLVLVRVSEAAGLPLVRQLLHAQEYWRVKGLHADLVILNEHPAEYLDEMQQHLIDLVDELRWSAWKDKSGGIFLLRSDGMAEDDRRLLAAAAQRRARRRSGRPRIAAASSGALALSRAVHAACGGVPASRAGIHARRDPAARHGQRHGRLHPRRPRIRRRARGGSRDAAAVVQRPGEPRLRNDGERVRVGLYLGGEQPREPSDAVRQRSGCRSDRRGHLSSRRRHRRGLGRHAGAAASPGGRGPLGGPSRCRCDPLSTRHSRPRAGAGGLRRARRSREAGRAHADEHLAGDAPPQRVRVRRVVHGPSPCRATGAS